MFADASEVWNEALRLHTAGDIAGGLRLARETLVLDPRHVGAIDHVATVLVSRRHKFEEGLALADLLVEVSPDDPGAWYTRGWLYEFAQHELHRSRDVGLDRDTLLEIAADSFRRCLSLDPHGKLRDDAADLLDHVENLLRD